MLRVIYNKNINIYKVDGVVEPPQFAKRGLLNHLSTQPKGGRNYPTQLRTIEPLPTSIVVIQLPPNLLRGGGQTTPNSYGSGDSTT
jgi:hypothetical protein